MHLSVVVPTLNGRDRLASCLDALAEHAPDAEVVVVNGPSTDGTTGMVREREAVDVLLELAERNVDVARNAGIRAASGDVVAVLDDGVRIRGGWADAVADAVADGADAVTGPRHRERAVGVSTSPPESEVIAGRSVTYFDGGNVAFAADALEALDGFDEHLQTGGARDAAHRLAGQGRRVDRVAAMAVRDDLETDGGATIRTTPPAMAGADDRDWGWKYRSLAYRLTKNYGLRPGIVRRVLGHAAADAAGEGADVVRGETTPSAWTADGRAVLVNALRGAYEGVRTRFRDRSQRRNPNGLSSREDRTVASYDRR